MKKVVLFILIYVISFSFAGCGNIEGAGTQEYAVLIGEDSDIVGKIENIDILVIDAAYFTGEDIAILKENGIKEIYTYLNVGSIEDFRPYYEEYEQYTLGPYENWPEERWIDVSNTEWQDFIKTRVDELSSQGVDGFFIDNADVYYLYPRDDIYEGIIEILSYIKENGKDVIINGGDCFVTRYIETGDERIILDGVNQENVYTMYDFDHKRYKKNNESDREYYTEYLDRVVAHGFRAYALEYARSRGIVNEAREYLGKHSYICYVSDNIELKLNN